MLSHVLVYYFRTVVMKNSVTSSVLPLLGYLVQSWHLGYGRIQACQDGLNVYKYDSMQMIYGLLYKDVWSRRRMLYVMSVYKYVFDKKNCSHNFLPGMVF